MVRGKFIAIVKVLVAGFVLLGLVVVVFSQKSKGPAVQRAANPQYLASGSEARVIADANGVPELWLVPKGSKQMVRVSKLRQGEGVNDKLLWSPGATLLAFSTYNLGGHSPLTTSHVWVVKADASGLTEVLIPAPNERFSTYVDHFIGDDVLQVGATILEPGQDGTWLQRKMFYRFTYPTGQMKAVEGGG